MRASEFLPQLRRRRNPRQVQASLALWLIAAGLVKKVVVATYLATEIVDPLFAVPADHGGFEALLGVYAYAIQIYADFSGYTDIAIGLALLLGFRFPQNFDAPYTAASLQDFWRRWHMTLSRWLRDYLYISLGGNRRGRARTYANLIITMLLGGLWHGAAWTFVVWGLLHGVGLAVERWLDERRQRRGGRHPGRLRSRRSAPVGARSGGRRPRGRAGGRRGRPAHRRDPTGATRVAAPRPHVPLRVPRAGSSSGPTPPRRPSRSSARSSPAPPARR